MTHNLPLGSVIYFRRGHISDPTVYLRAGNVSVGGFKVPYGDQSEIIRTLSNRGLYFPIQRLVLGTDFSATNKRAGHGIPPLD